MSCLITFDFRSVEFGVLFVKYKFFILALCVFVCAFVRHLLSMIALRVFSCVFVCEAPVIYDSSLCLFVCNAPVIYDSTMCVCVQCISSWSECPHRPDHDASAGRKEKQGFVAPGIVYL